jgi:WD40 repeat protein
VAWEIPEIMVLEDLENTTPNSERVTEGTSTYPYCATFYNKDKLIAGYEDTGEVRIWDISGKGDIKLHKVLYLGYKETVEQIATQRDMLIATSGPTVHVWSLKDMQHISHTTLTGHTESISCLEVTEDRLITGDEDKEIRVWSTKENKCLATLKGHTDNISSLVAQGRMLFSGSADGSVRVWDLHTYSTIATLSTNSTKPVKKIGIYEDRIIAFVNQQCLCWDLRAVLNGIASCDKEHAYQLI